jgi:hypothetical protein
MLTRSFFAQVSTSKHAHGRSKFSAIAGNFNIEHGTSAAAPEPERKVLRARRIWKDNERSTGSSEAFI